LALVQNWGVANDNADDLSNPNNNMSPSPADDIGDHATGDNPDTKELARNIKLYLLFLTSTHF
jgi:hypothetical protein